MEGTDKRIKAYEFRDLEYFKLTILAIHEGWSELVG